MQISGALVIFGCNFVLIRAVVGESHAFEDNDGDWHKRPPPVWLDANLTWQIDPYKWTDDTPMVNVTVSGADSYNISGFPTKYNFGLNIPVYIPAEFYDKYAVDIIKGGGFNLLRFPGGSVADDYIWDFDYENYPWFKGRAYEPSGGYYGTDDFIKLCRETQAEPIIQVNYAVFVRYGHDKGIALAEKWLEYFRKKGLRVKYWTLGNENYGNWETPNSERYGRTLDAAAYGKAFVQLADALKKLDSNIFIGPVVRETDEESGLGAKAKSWMELLGPYIPNHADFLDFHSYFMDVGNPYRKPSTEDIYRNDDNTHVDGLSYQVENTTRTYANLTDDLPIALTEWNINLVHPRSDDTPDQMIGALIVADLVTKMTSFGNAFRANTFFAIADVMQSKYYLPERTPGDLGLLTRDDPGAPDGTPRPVWYAYAMMKNLVAGKQLFADVTDGPADYPHFSLSGEDWVNVSKLVQARAWQFDSSKDVSVMLINRNQASNAEELVAVCLRNCSRGRTNYVRGWVLSPGDPYSKEPVRDKGVRWNGHKGEHVVGGPFPLTYFPAMSAFTGDSAPQGCDAVVTVPSASIVGVIFYSDDLKIINMPVPPKPRSALQTMWWDQLGDKTSVAFVYTAFGVVTLGCALLFAMAVCMCISQNTHPQVARMGTDPEELMDRNVRWRSLFNVRGAGAWFFLFMMYLDFAFLVWIPLRALNSGFQWNSAVYWLTEFFSTVSSTAYYVCSCFEPKPLRGDDDWRSDDMDAMLNHRARAVRAAVVQCHYNEPMVEIAYSLRCNLRYFRDLGFSRESRPYYICDDGFFTGDGDHRKQRQSLFCHTLRHIVFDALGKPGVAMDDDDDEPLALREGTNVDTVWRPDCAKGFLIWSIGDAADHVYLVARDKPKPHHSKAGNINNLLYNVLHFQYGPRSSCGLTPPSYAVLLDQDMCLGHDFVKALPAYRPVEIVAQSLPIFEADLKRTCFVQSPQHFRDLQRMDVTFNSNATFYKAVQIGRGAVGMAAFAGTNCVWDVSKLMSLGGIQYGSVTEDSNTSIAAHKQGLRSRYIDMPVAAGNSPQTVNDSIKQVCSRWAKGAVDMLLQRCSSRTSPENLVDDIYKVPPEGLTDAYGKDLWPHFRKGTDRQMPTSMLESLLRNMFSIETMVFPFWSVTALAHAFLACWLLLTMKPPLDVPLKLEYLVVVLHALTKMFYPWIAFPKVEFVEILYSMAAWMGLAPTMLTHAIFASFKEKLCPCFGSGQWTSIGGRKLTFGKSQLGICIVVAILVNMSIYRGLLCYLAPVVSADTCPTIDMASQVSGKMLPSKQEVVNMRCDFTVAPGGKVGDLCGILRDDRSALFCYCCCKYSGQCGYAGFPKEGSMRPADQEPPCDVFKTLCAESYAALLICLGMPWVFAVLRDSRRFHYVEGVHAEVRAKNVEMLHRGASYISTTKSASTSNDFQSELRQSPFAMAAPHQSGISEDLKTILLQRDV
eukprot:TRINITY_DN3569_c0_g1_i1.p1 TRINITY_DN3569_c0_g1~~TRINITY_DN3569_c0_g1_i1.p1  ORF type:complete len:1469 (-),score=170.19 TRINITY_DN3569_c0_g1_i1:161-4567(-)